jgi:hypothetical protein
VILRLRARHEPIAILRFGPSCASLVEVARLIHRLGIFTGLFRWPKIESVRKVTQQRYRRARHARGRTTVSKAIVTCAKSRLAIRPIFYRLCKESPLADIFVQCPRTGAPISTGLKSEWVLLNSLPPVPIPVRCPACGQMHKWVPQDAWMGPALPAPARRIFSGSRAAS